MSRRHVASDREAAEAHRVRGLILRWGPAIVWMGALFCFSSMQTLPATPWLEDWAWNDKLQHSVGYALLAALIWRALDREKPKWWRLLIAVAISSAYGVTDEFHQRFVPPRECSALDWAADTIGSLAAVIVISILDGRRWFWLKNKKRKPTK